MTKREKDEIFVNKILLFLLYPKLQLVLINENQLFMNGKINKEPIFRCSFILACSLLK